MIARRALRVGASGLTATMARSLEPGLPPDSSTATATLTVTP